MYISTLCAKEKALATKNKRKATIKDEKDTVSFQLVRQSEGFGAEEDVLGGDAEGDNSIVAVEHDIAHTLRVQIRCLEFKSLKGP